MERWQDLSGAELEARLRQRGVTRPSPATLVARREEPEVAKLITQLLNRRN